MRVVLPTAFSGIMTGVLLGLARVMGETAPLLILGPYTKSIATNLFSGYIPTLPTMINQDRSEASPIAVERVWAAALTLILLVLLLNLAARLIARFGSVKKPGLATHGQAHRRQGPECLLRGRRPRAERGLPRR